MPAVSSPLSPFWEGTTLSCSSYYVDWCHWPPSKSHAPTCNDIFCQRHSAFSLHLVLSKGVALSIYCICLSLLSFPLTFWRGSVMLIPAHVVPLDQWKLCFFLHLFDMHAAYCSFPISYVVLLPLVTATADTFLYPRRVSLSPWTSRGYSPPWGPSFLSSHLGFSLHLNRLGIWRGTNDRQFRLPPHC